jgi:hypothetical protein
MPKLRRHRRDHRARAPKRRKRRNLVKFIPEADSDFALTSRNFVSWLKHQPEVYNVSAEEIASIEKAVTAFRSALFKASHRFCRTPQLTMQKNEARNEAERLVRTFGRIIGADPRVPASKKKLLRIKVRPEKLGKRPCPKAPPTLRFLGSGDGVTGGIAEGSGSGIHVLAFTDESNGGLTIKPSSTMMTSRRAKPDGAVRVELFFDMIPVGEPVPRLPNERGWPKYLRSFTASPMEVQFPIPSEPMLLVYWAKWADSRGEVSRWSKPCVARLEGWTPSLESSSSRPALTQGQATIAAHVQTRYVFIQTPIAGELPDGLEGDAMTQQIAALRSEQRLLEAA